MRWIKMPGPGQFRGGGEWVDFETVEPWCGDAAKWASSPPTRAAFWQWLKETGWLPIHEGDAPRV